MRRNTVTLVFVSFVLLASLLTNLVLYAQNKSLKSTIQSGLEDEDPYEGEVLMHVGCVAPESEFFRLAYTYQYPKLGDTVSYSVDSGLREDCPVVSFFSWELYYPQGELKEVRLEADTPVKISDDRGYSWEEGTLLKLTPGYIYLIDVQGSESMSFEFVPWD